MLALYQFSCQRSMNKIDIEICATYLDHLCEQIWKPKPLTLDLVDSLVCQLRRLKFTLYF